MMIDKMVFGQFMNIRYACQQLELQIYKSLLSVPLASASNLWLLAWIYICIYSTVIIQMRIYYTRKSAQLITTLYWLSLIIGTNDDQLLYFIKSLPYATKEPFYWSVSLVPPCSCDYGLLEIPFISSSHAN